MNMVPMFTSAFGSVLLSVNSCSQTAIPSAAELLLYHAVLGQVTYSVFLRVGSSTYESGDRAEKQQGRRSNNQTINLKKVTHWVEQRRTAKSADNSSRDLFCRTHCKLTHFWLILMHWPVHSEQPSTHIHTPSHTLYPSWRPLHFLLVPIMQEQAALLPGSQAGEEGTPVWSHGAHGFPFTSTPPSLPPSLPPSSHFSLSFSFSPSLSFLCHWLFSFPLLTFVSLHLPHWFTLWK